MTTEKGCRTVESVETVSATRPRLILSLLTLSFILSVGVYGPFAYNTDEIKRVFFVVMVGLIVVAVPLFSLLKLRFTLSLPIGLLSAYGGWLLLELLSWSASERTFQTELFFSFHGAVLVFAVVLCSTVSNREDLFFFLRGLLGILLLLVIFAFVDLPALIVGAGLRYPEKTVSLTGNTNSLGAVLSMLLPIAVWATIEAFSRVDARPVHRRTVGRIYYLLLVASGFVVLLMTTSQGAWLGLFVGGVVALWIAHSQNLIRLGQRSLRRYAMPVVGALIIIGSALTAIDADIRRVVGNSIAEVRAGELLDDRLPAWNAAVRLWRLDPPRTVVIGAGPGSYYAHVFELFPSDYRLRFHNRSFKHAHNEYLELLGESGIIGLLLWGAYFTMGLQSAWRAARNGGNPPAVRLGGVALLWSIAAGLVHAVVSIAYRRPGVANLFYLLPVLAWLLATENEHRETGWLSRTVQIEGRQAFIVAIATAAAMVPAVFAVVKHGVSQFYMQAAMHAPAPDPVQARVQGLRRLQTAVTWDPTNIYAWYFAHVTHRGHDAERTIATANQIETIIPWYRDVVSARGVAQIVLGNYEEAVEDFEVAVGYDAFDIPSRTNLVVCLALTGATEDAARELDALIQHADRFAEHKQKDLPETVRHADIVFAPLTTTLHQMEDHVGYPLDDQRNIRRVAQVATEAAPYGPNSVYGFVELSIGYILLARGAPEEALDSFVRAARASQLSEVETDRIGELARALHTDLMQALAHDPEDDQMTPRERERTLRRAKAMLRAIQQIQPEEDLTAEFAALEAVRM